MARLPTLRRPAKLAGTFAGWRGLGRFWLLVAVLCGAGAGFLAWRGPLPPIESASRAGAPHPEAAQGAGGSRAGTHQPEPAGTDQAGASADPQAHAAAPHAPPGAGPSAGHAAASSAGPSAGSSSVSSSGGDHATLAAGADPALLEPGPSGGSAPLPRIAADGRRPMQVYAAPFDRRGSAPRVAVLLAGMGLSEADSLEAARTLPAGITFAVSPYGGALPAVVAAARATQHEFLLAIPMEPQGFPLADPGNRALMSNLSRADNRTRLLWALTRTAGYVGATAALGELRGERFLGLPDQMEPVLTDLSTRGLLFVDPRVGEPALPLVWSRGVDLVLDDPPTRESIDARLAELESIARTKGTALGLAGTPRPATVQRLAAWSASLRDKGLALAPVSAIVQPPPKDVPQ